MRPRKPETGPEEQDREFVTALARGLEILRAFRKEGDWLGNKDFAERTGLKKPTVSRLTHTLHKLGYLSYDPTTARYALAPPVLSLGYACLSNLPVRDIARPYMQELADYSGLPIALAARDRLTMIYVSCCRSTSAITLAIEVGQHIKLATTAIGRAYLAALPVAERQTLLDEIRDHEGADWTRVQEGIAAAVEEYATWGFCTSFGDWKPEVNSVAVPLAAANGAPLMAVNCGGGAAQLDRARIFDDIGPRLIGLADRLSPAKPF